MATGFIFFSHIIPVILGFMGVLCIITGVMDNRNIATAIGIILFFIAAISPFIILPTMLA